MQRQKTCVVHTEVTCSRDVERGRVAGTKSQHAQTHENVAGTCPLVRTNTFMIVLHQFGAFFVPATCPMGSNKFNSMRHIAGTKYPCFTSLLHNLSVCTTKFFGYCNMSLKHHPSRLPTLKVPLGVTKSDQLAQENSYVSPRKKIFQSQ